MKCAVHHLNVASRAQTTLPGHFRDPEAGVVDEGVDPIDRGLFLLLGF
jgi:hypothetical protein